MNKRIELLKKAMIDTFKGRYDVTSKEYNGYWVVRVEKDKDTVIEVTEEGIVYTDWSGYEKLNGNEKSCLLIDVAMALGEWYEETEKVTYKNVLKELREKTLNELVDMETKTTSLISIKEVISLTYSREEVEEVTLLPLAKEIYLRYSNILEHNNKIHLFNNIDKEFKEIEKLKLSRGERYKETFDEMYEKLGFKSCLSMLYIKTDRAINLENQLLERYDYVRDIEDIDGEDRDIIDNLIDSVLDFINYAVMLEVLIRGGSNKNS